MKVEIKRWSQVFRGYMPRPPHLLVLAVGICLIPSRARAVGLVDIVSLLEGITSTIQGAIGGALDGIQALNTSLNHFRQEIIWPLAAINQSKAFVNSTRAQYGQVMFGILNMRNNSATLPAPLQLESLFRNGQAGSIGQTSMAYTNVYSTVPSATNANQFQRNMVDMDDSLAIDSLKTTVISDQTARSVLALADALEQQSETAAPGTAPMISTEAQIAELETQALTAKLLASELRAEAAKLAHQNAWFKQSSAAARNLQNQMQQVLSNP